MNKLLFFACICLALLPLISIANAIDCNTTVYVGDSLVSQGYSIKLDSISSVDGISIANVSISYNGFSIRSMSVNLADNGLHTFTNPLTGGDITIRGCQSLVGANGFIQVAITGIDFTLIHAAEFENISSSAPSAVVEFSVYIPSASDGETKNLEVGQSAPVGNYTLKLVGLPSDDTVSVEISDSQNQPLGIYEIHLNDTYEIPASSLGGVSPLRIVPQRILASGNAPFGSTAGIASISSLPAQDTSPLSNTPSANKVQSANDIGALVAVLVIFVGMIIAASLALYYLSRPSNGNSPMKLLENETRAGILQELSETEKIPTDISLRLGKSKATVIEHLDTLVQAELVERIETPGKKFVYYRLTQKGRQALLRMAG